jgi:hypothetical protein
MLLPQTSNRWLALANTRTLEFPFALSADARSEFSTQFPIFSAGKIVVEANWKALHQSMAAAPLTLKLMKPDGSQAAHAEANDPLRLEYQLTEQEVDGFNTRRPAKWSIKIFRNTPTNAQEISGKLRITIPAVTRALVDTQFTLLGLGNAQELPFNIIAAGRIVVESDWEAETQTSSSLPLTLSLIHSSSSRTIARKQGTSPLRIEYLATAQDLDSGNRWFVRIQNDNNNKLKGRLKITYTPSL